MYIYIHIHIFILLYYIILYYIIFYSILFYSIILYYIQYIYIYIYVYVYIYIYICVCVCSCRLRPERHAGWFLCGSLGSMERNFWIERVKSIEKFTFLIHAHMGPYGSSWTGLGRLRKLSIRLLDQFRTFRVQN